MYVAGDANGDGAVDIFDAVLVGQAWQTERGDEGYSDAADLNNDGEVNIFDAVAIGRNWQDRADCPPTPSACARRTPLFPCSFQSEAVREDIRLRRTVGVDNIKC